MRSRSEADIVFLALPDKAAATLAPALLAAGVRVIDVSGAFRLRDAAQRAEWYPETGALPEGVAYGLTEWARPSVRAAQLIANPGCYPTASLLALLPLVRAGMLSPGADVIIDAKSGVSGRGKAPTEGSHFSEVHGSLSTYGVFHHKHGAEIEQELGREVTFTPHLRADRSRHSDDHLRQGRSGHHGRAVARGVRRGLSAMRSS